MTHESIIDSPAAAELSPQEKVKVLQIVTRLNIGGVAPHVILLASGLDQEKFEVTILSGQEAQQEGSMEQLAKQKDVKLIRIPGLQREVSLFRDARAFWRIYLIIRRHKPDVVHTHLSKAGLLGRLAARMAGVPVIVHTFHGHIFDGFFSPIKSRLFLMLERFLSSLSTCLVAVNKMIDSDLTELRIAKSKCRVIENGFDLERFVGTARHQGHFRRELGLDRTHILVGAVARLVPIKGCSYLLEAAADFLDASTKLRLILVGDGELREELGRQARSLGIENRLIFTGFKEDMENVYSDLDILVLPSLSEGLPTVILEALCAGLPVVATRVGAIPDLITVQTGIIVKSRDSQAIAKAVRELVQKLPLNHNARIRQEVCQRFGVKRLVEETEMLYNDLLSQVKGQ